MPSILFLSTTFIALNIPVFIGLHITRNGTDKSKKAFKTVLVSTTTILLLLWPILTFFISTVFSIGGGNPTKMPI